MLEKILHRLTSREQSHKQYTKPLRMATSYKYTPNEIIPEPKLDFNAILELAKQHPGFQTSTIKPCFLDQHALFVGFDKPARIATHVIVYPEQIYRSSQWYDLMEHASKRGIKIGIFQLKSILKCIEIIKNTQALYVMDPGHLKLRHWSVVPDNSQKNTKTDPSPNHIRK